MAKEEKTKKEKKIIEKKISLGHDKNGKLIRRNVRGRNNAEIERKAFEMRQRYLEQSGAPSNQMTFITYARNWLKNTKGMKSLNTRAMYQNVIEKHLAPELADLFFDEITLSDLQGIINKNFDKYETCNKIRLTIRQLYASAADDDLLPRKAANVKKLVIPQKPKNEKRALTEAERQALFDADLNDKQRAFVLTLYYTGMRREEALALTSDAFDFSNKTVRVSQTLVLDHGRAVILPTAKNNYSLRDILLTDKYIEYILEYVKSKQGFIFDMPRQPGEPMTESSFRRFWQGIIDKLVLKAPTAASLTPHIFRHDYATRLYYSEISPKMAAKLLGHRDTTMIMKVYAHLDEKKENALDKLNRGL